MAHYMPKGVTRADVTRAPVEFYASDAASAPSTDRSAAPAGASRAAGADKPSTGSRKGAAIDCPPGVDVPSPWAREYARPAPRQVERRPEGVQVSLSGDYNIWYNKYATGYEDRLKSRAPALYRCHVENDSGVTKASRSKEVSSVCIYFVRGCCHFGHDCNYLHRMPTEADDLALTPTTDVFGRERHANDRDDMGGVGSFSRDNFTLYVSGIGSAADHGSWDTVRQAILTDFGEWGPVHHLRIIPSRAIAFLTYKWRATAEIAKESMANQKLLTLPGSVKPLINVRWAYDDPNPAAKERTLQHRQDTLRDAMVRTELLKRGYDPDAVLDESSVVASGAHQPHPPQTGTTRPASAFAPMTEPPPAKRPRVGPAPHEVSQRSEQEFSALFGGFYDDPVVQETLSAQKQGVASVDPADANVQFFRAVAGVGAPPGFAGTAAAAAAPRAPGTTYDFAAAAQRQQVFTNYADMHAQHAAAAASSALLAAHGGAAAAQSHPPGFAPPSQVTSGGGAPPGFGRNGARLRAPAAGLGSPPPGMPTAADAASDVDDRPPGLAAVASLASYDDDDGDLPPGISTAVSSASKA